MNVTFCLIEIQIWPQEDIWKGTLKGKNQTHDKALHMKKSKSLRKNKY